MHLVGRLTTLALFIVLATPIAAQAQSRGDLMGAVSSDAPATLMPQGVGPSRASRSNSAQYADTVGDASIANDISLTTVSNDDAGNLTFTISVVNYAYFTTGDTLGLYLDTDMNPNTGSEGSDYVVWVDGASNSIGLARWTGLAWDFTTPQSTLSGSSYYGETIHINRSDLGGTGALQFWIGTRYEGIGTYYDFAPEAGWWSYAVTITPPAPTPTPPAPAPALPAAAPAAPAAAPVSAAGPAPAPDATLTIAAAKANLRGFIKGKLHAAPRYAKLACTKRGAAAAACSTVFVRGAVSFRASATVENYVDGNAISHDVTVEGTRTDAACVKRKRKQHKPVRTCTTKVVW